MTNFVVHRRLRSSGQKHPQSQSTTSGSILRPISSDPKGLRAVRASLSSRVDLGHVAYWTLIVTSAVFLPYSLAIVSGYEPAVRTVSSGALDKAADAGQHIMDHLPLWQLHTANAVLYLCATPIQFLPSVRKQFPPLHRASGYLFLFTGTVLVVTGLVMAPLSEFPGFVAPSVALAVLWGLFGGIAMWKIKKKRVQGHREWMVRVAAAGYSVVLTRPLVVAIHLVTGVSHRAAGQSATWLSLLIMVAGTEIYIQSRRPPV